MAIRRDVLAVIGPENLTHLPGQSNDSTKGFWEWAQKALSEWRRTLRVKFEEDK